jgi:subtilisin family serine protease
MKRRVRIGIIDSGVNSSHPHVGGIAGGVTIGAGARDASCVDRLGHGTAIAALIHARAPQADLFAVKIFHDALVTTLTNVLSALDWCLDHELDLINLSLGTTNDEHRAAFEVAVARASAEGKAIVSAYHINGVPALPGCLPGVVAVTADSSKSPGEHGMEHQSGKTVFTASPYPRDIPGVPRERNLQGVSFAVANVTATLACLCDSSTLITDWEQSLVDQLCGEETTTSKVRATG